MLGSRRPGPCPGDRDEAGPSGESVIRNTSDASVANATKPPTLPQVTVRRVRTFSGGGHLRNRCHLGRARLGARHVAVRSRGRSVRTAPDASRGHGAPGRGVAGRWAGNHTGDAAHRTRPAGPGNGDRHTGRPVAAQAGPGGGDDPEKIVLVSPAAALDPADDLFAEQQQRERHPARSQDHQQDEKFRHHRPPVHLFVAVRLDGFHGGPFAWHLRSNPKPPSSHELDATTATVAAEPIGGPMSRRRYLPTMPRRRSQRREVWDSRHTTPHQHPEGEPADA